MFSKKLSSKWKLLDQANSSSDLSQILILQFPVPRASLPPSSSLSNFGLANWNPSSTPSSSCSSSVSLFCPTRFDHTPPQVLNTPKHMLIQAIYWSYYLMGQTRYPSKGWVFKTRFSFKVWQHDQLQHYIQYKVCWILCKMVGAPTFSQRYLWIQPPLSVPLTQSVFTSLSHPYFFTKSSLQFPLSPPSSIPQQFFSFLFLRTTIPTIYTKKIFPPSAI